MLCHYAKSCRLSTPRTGGLSYLTVWGLLSCIVSLSPTCSLSMDNCPIIREDGGLILILTLILSLSLSLCAYRLLLRLKVSEGCFGQLSSHDRQNLGLSTTYVVKYLNARRLTGWAITSYPRVPYLTLIHMLLQPHLRSSTKIRNLHVLNSIHCHFEVA